MKHFIIFVLTGYKKIVSPVLDMVFGPGRGCRFEETCSQYAIRIIRETGVVKGIALTAIRILRCQPFSTRNAKYESI